MAFVDNKSGIYLNFMLLTTAKQTETSFYLLQADCNVKSQHTVFLPISICSIT
jgi:hypothetical protein